jgi:hypothetical protein
MYVFVDFMLWRPTLWLAPLLGLVRSRLEI